MFFGSVQYAREIHQLLNIVTEIGGIAAVLADEALLHKTTKLLNQTLKRSPSFCPPNQAPVQWDISQVRKVLIEQREKILKLL